MARKIATRQKRKQNPIIIGAGLTERWYFTHLQSKYNLRIKIRPRFFGHEDIISLTKRTESVLADEGVAIVVFDADVSTWNDVEKSRLLEFKKNYSNNKDVIICDSLPSIEYWLLLHYENTNKHFGTSERVIEELRKHIPNFDKTESFLSRQKWVDGLCADEQLVSACNRAVSFGEQGESYSNVWKAMEYVDLYKKETVK
jgi:hypothetical protein